MIHTKRTLIVIGITILLNTGLIGQDIFPSLSPKGIVIQKVGNTEVQIEYERPSARKRTVFGRLVPWNKVWRTGAGRSTKVSFDREVVVEGQTLSSGTYSLFTIPDEKEWMVIFNRDTTLYGSFDYDAAKDAARFIVKPQITKRYYETLTFDIDIIPNNAEIYLSWEHTQIHFRLQTSTDKQLMTYIDTLLLTGKDTDANAYANAAEQLFYLGHRINDALTLADMAIIRKSNVGFARRVKVDIYERLQRYDEALEEIDIAIDSETDDREITRWKERANSIKDKM